MLDVRIGSLCFIAHTTWCGISVTGLVLEGKYSGGFGYSSEHWAVGAIGLAVFLPGSAEQASELRMAYGARDDLSL